METTTPRKFMQIADILLSNGYSVGQQLGEGTYSKVRSAERLSDGLMCAVKIIDRGKVKHEYLKKFMPRELEIIQRLKHDNVIRVFDVIHSGCFVFHIMQYAENGDVLQMIQRDTIIEEEKCRRIFADIVKGLQYIHGLNIVHRDLKCENILLFKSNNAAISDFGFSRAFGENDKSMMCRTFCGSAAYASPEVLRGIPYDPKLNDVWSAGIILFTMLCGTMPFNDGNMTRLVQKQTSRDFTYPKRVQDKISAAAKNMVFTILDPSVNRRPSIENLSKCEWLRSAL